jgi:DNA-directed RNA polymerase specialized sigma24 family protein
MPPLTAVFAHGDSKKQEQPGVCSFSEPSVEAGFREFVDRYGARTRAIVYAMFGDQHLADEVSAGVFVEAHRSPFGTADPWLELVRLAGQACRRRHWLAVIRGERRNDQVYRNREPAHHQTKNAIQLLSKLSWHERFLLVLRDVAQLSIEQMAAVLDLAPERVKSDLLRARMAAVKAAKK